MFFSSLSLTLSLVILTFLTLRTVLWL
jgi:hypothetical protein